MSAARHARTAVALEAALVLALMGNGAALAGASDVDTGFGTGGSTTVAVGGSADVPGLVQRDDGVLIMGTSVDTSFMTVALTAGGDLLDTYGTGGISSTPIPGAASATVSDIALQSNGRVVLAGWEDATTGSNRFAVARFRPNGTPDDSFSGDGVFTTPFPQGDAYGYGVTIQRDGKIVAVGEVDPSKGVSNPAILRLDPDGTLDRSFGDHGRAMVRLPDGHPGYDSPWRVAVQSHGKLVMAGWQQRVSGSNYKTLAMRLRANGTLDPTFSHDGFTAIDVDALDNYAYGLDTDGGKLVLGTHTSAGNAGFVRLNSDGSRDTTFGGDGVVTHTMSVPWDPRAVVVAPDHRIVAANGFAGGPNVLVLKPRGGLDTGYSTDGEGVGPLANVFCEALVLTGTGKIVVAGRVGNDVVAVRFLAP